MKRDVKELLVLVRDYIKVNHGYDIYGICDAFIVLYADNEISYDERKMLAIYLDKRLPPRVTKFGYCWDTKDKKSRINWLDEQINKLS